MANHVRLSTRVVAALLLAGGLLSASPTVQAEDGYVIPWRTRYPASLSYENSQCALCHTAIQANRDLNPYGAAMRVQLGTVDQRLQAIEVFNSDNDPGGWTNLAEINANTQPGWEVGDAAVPSGITGLLDPDPTPPTVTAVFPAPGGSNVDALVAVTATFDKDINPATVNTSTFVLRDLVNNIVSATVSYNARTATLRPSFPLGSLATYTARVVGGESGVKDLAGIALAADFSWAFTTAQIVPSTSIFSAVLPVSRSAVVGSPVTVFGTIINAGTLEATTCGVALAPTAPAGLSLLYQTTDPATNQVIGLPNTPVNIAPGFASQSFVVALTPSAPFAPVDMPLVFDCDNSPSSPTFVGVNTLLISASTTPVPDVVALAATLDGNGIVNIPGASGAGAFAVASVNVGAGGAITVAADTGGATLPVNLTLCETNPGTGQCLQTPAASVATAIANGATPTFAIFVQGTGSAIPFDPAVNRVFVRFRDGGGIVRGATSVAVRTQQ